MTALIVCIRFSASSNTIEAGDSNTSSVTSSASRPYFSLRSLPTLVSGLWNAGRRLAGVEAVIDKDMASALLACDLGADALLIATDVDGVYRGWGTPEQEAIREATPEQLLADEFAEGSMGPKVRAACMFVERTSGFAAIGTLTAVDEMIRREAGTIVKQPRSSKKRRSARAGVA